MKKGIVSVAIMLITVVLLITTANATFTLSASIKSDSSTIKVGNTVTLTINVNEKVIASNFDINYDSTILKLEGSGTSNLSVAEKDGKIACIYADMSGKGTNEFKVKFKALKETTGTNLKIENAKFRAEGQDDSYTGEQISGVNNAITVKVESTEEKETSKPSTPSTSSTGNQVAGKDKTTTKTKTLPKTGKETGFAIAGIVVLAIVAIVFGKKSKELSKIFSSLSVFVIAFVMVTALNNSVYAEEIFSKQYKSGKLSNGENYIGIMLDKNHTSITSQELKSQHADIYSVGTKQNDIPDAAVVQTGLYLLKGQAPNETQYRIALYGDANGDGIICDTDDVMVIIDDYLGKLEAKDEYRLAANLYARDDIMQIINRYLGKLDKDLVVEGIDIVGQWRYSSATKNGQEVPFNEVFGSSAIGSPGYLTFKEDGTFVNDFPGTTSVELENEGKYLINGNNIKLQFTKESVNLTYKSKDNTISYPYGEYTLILKSEDKEYLKENWEYSLFTGIPLSSNIKADNTIFLEKYIGKDPNVTIKEKYIIDGIQYTTHMEKTTEYNSADNTDDYGPFIDNKSIKTITFESTDILQGDISSLFLNCTNLERVIGFGGNITNMYNCFNGCTSLLNEKNKNSSDYVEGAEIDIPDSVKNLNNAFVGCSSMKYLPTISSGSKLEQAQSAFSGCSGATSGKIYLNETVIVMAYMFKDCNMLGHYTGEGFKIYSYMKPDKIQFCANAFENCGVEAYGSSAYGSQPHEFIVKNATSETDETFIFFKDLIKNSVNCSLTVKIE